MVEDALTRVGSRSGLSRASRLPTPNQSPWTTNAATATKTQSTISRSQNLVQESSKTRLLLTRIPETPQEAPVAAKEFGSFRSRVRYRRKDCQSDMTDADFTAKVVRTELGTEKNLDSLTRPEFDHVCAALKDGKYDWATAERIPD